MADNKVTCEACEGTGMLADENGWQYTCTICNGEGKIDPEQKRSKRNPEVDEHKRNLD